MNENVKKYQCKLCQSHFEYSKMSEEHYPARNVGNFDIVSLDIIETIDSILSPKTNNIFRQRVKEGENLVEVFSEFFDTHLANDLYPEGRTSRTLCIGCNTFLGKYDESYQKFFKVNGDPKKVRGFQEHTKLQIIKAIFGKFLSIPETQNEKFDFIEFVKNEEEKNYTGIWKLFLIKRNHTTDLLGLKDIRTGKLTYDEGVVYELSDEKFIYNLMNFNKHGIYVMTDIFDILNKNYKLVEGVGNDGGYHGQIFLTSLFETTDTFWEQD